MATFNQDGQKNHGPVYNGKTIDVNGDRVTIDGVPVTGTRGTQTSGTRTSDTRTTGARTGIRTRIRTILTGARGGN